MRSKTNPFIPDSYLINNENNANRPYLARNILKKNIFSSSVLAQEILQEPAPQTEIEQPPDVGPQEQFYDIELPPGDIPALPAEPGTLPVEVPEESGYISVGVFTASGALPVKDAVVTVYELDEAGEENVLYHVVTDDSGQVPVLELPVVYDRSNPLLSPDFYFSTYNLRVQAINYYNFNLVDIRVFPNTTTNFAIELIPAPIGLRGTDQEMTTVIPPSPIDISND